MSVTEKVLNNEVLDAVDYRVLSDRSSEVVGEFLRMRGLEDQKPFIFIDFDEKKYHKFSLAKNFQFHLTSFSHEAMMIGKYLLESDIPGRSMIIGQNHKDILDTGLVPDEFFDIVHDYIVRGILPDDFTAITDEDVEGFGKKDYELGSQNMIFGKDEEGELRLIETSQMLRKVYEDKNDYYLVNHNECQYVKISDPEIIMEKRLNDDYGHAILPFMYYLVDPSIDLDHSWMRRQYLGAWFGDNVEIVRSNTPGFDFAIYGSDYDYEEVAMPLQGQDFLAIELED